MSLLELVWYYSNYFNPCIPILWLLQLRNPIYEYIIAYTDCGSACGLKCPDDWSLFRGNCYKIYETQANEFSTSEEICSMYTGSTLASIQSADENNFILSLRTSKMASAGWSFWIGATDRKKEGDFKWIDGSPWSYTNWRRPDEPNDAGSGEDCVEMSAQGTWNDNACDNFVHAAVCKVKPGTT